MFSPVLAQGVVDKHVYFPGDSRWYEVSYFLKDGSSKEETEGRCTWKKLPAPLDIIPIHFRGGNVLTMQRDAMDTTKSRQNPFDFEVALDDDEKAAGSLFYDDGISFKTISENKYFSANYEFKPTSNGYMFSGKVIKDNYDGMKDLKLAYFGIMGLKIEGIERVLVNGNDFGDYNFGSDGRFQIFDLKLPMNKDMTIELISM